MSEEQIHILVVDDDERLRRLLKKFLSEKGFNVSIAEDAQDARKKLSLLEFDLIVLDLMMPGESGLDFAKDFKQSNDTPILMLTAMGESEDRITGLECGAEDYLTKPFEPRELVLRINNILKRVVRKAPQEETEVIKLGALKFDAERHTLTRGDEMIHLTASEASLLVILAEQSGTILSREKLAELSGIEGNDRTIDVQVTRLRRKIEDDPKLPRFLQTVRGQGYVLRPE
ncbi:DNA-binding response regulator in two-component regulatory system with EnvZ [Candidatus Terasakiella magnetica]|uniref:DNA-binding response regulator in two-component regulatory system with EnvZ n=1 Tax=Candidatus Terasakiella magnetica TaxID=1867952 RepID=A0A1C3RLQ8_9PROT|nr:response regulator [Candidatus Terasakiella magnetica]SCA58201.1 DNA-binding response regulator in two-component regulatory system with EnvZ [Candidatus Terasakiella magnetica]